MPPPSQELRGGLQAAQTPISPHISSSPLFPEARQEQDDGLDRVDVDGDPKTGQRRLFNLGKKTKEEESEKMSMDAPVGTTMMPQTQAAIGAMRPDAPLKRPLDLKPQPQPIPIPPSRHPYPSGLAASPSRLRSSSPRLVSPASSEIFERNVQEPVPISALQNENTPAHMATHVITEDHIPPALEASAQAITSEGLNPDDVEIVTSVAHQPAGASVLEGSSSHADLTQLGSPATLKHEKSEDSEPASFMYQSGSLSAVATADDDPSTYGQLDPNDVRRLSFISFADVVQGEHQQQAASELGEAGSRDSLHIASFPSSTPHERAASPFRSPRSPGSASGGVTTPPPPSVNLHSFHAEQSPVRSVGVVSPMSQHGELQIETMRQAVRKTASGDLSGVRSAGMSPISDEIPVRETRSRTNT